MRKLIIWLSSIALLYSTDKSCGLLVEKFINAQINKKIRGEDKDLWAGYDKYCEGLETCGDFWKLYPIGYEINWTKDCKTIVRVEFKSRVKEIETTKLWFEFIVETDDENSIEEHHYRIISKVRQYDPRVTPLRY